MNDNEQSENKLPDQSRQQSENTQHSENRRSSEGAQPSAAAASTVDSSVVGIAHRPDPRQNPEAATRLGILTEGSRFGGYLVGAGIGAGGMACIYRAEHEGLRRQVALKVMTNGFATDPERRERFLREARIAAAIKHPNVVNIFDVGVYQDIPYLVMELLEGEDFEALLQRKGALDESALIDIMVPVVAGLAAVHDAGIVHRDLKPGNIFLAKNHYDEPEPKLLDFGISKSSGTDELKLTKNGLLIGTPFYMAPEGLRGSEMTPRSDQYSLGVVMYECVTGINPFIADTFGAVYERITQGTYASAQQVNARVSPRLNRIIERAMHRDPSQRYRDVRELGRDLLMLAGQRTRITWGLTFGDLARAGVETGAPSSTEVNNSDEAEGFRGNRKLWAVWGAAALLLGGAVLLGGVLDQHAGSSRAAAVEVAEEQLSLSPYAAPDVSPSPVSPPAVAKASGPAEVNGAPPVVEQPAQPQPLLKRPTGAAPKPPTKLEWQRRQRDLAAQEQEPSTLPEWAPPGLESEGLRAGRDKPNVGANNAPILD